MIFYGDSGKGKTPLASCLAAMVARDAGLDEFVMVSSPDMLRSAVERNLLRDERPLLLDELQISPTPARSLSARQEATEVEAPAKRSKERRKTGSCLK